MTSDFRSFFNRLRNEGEKGVQEAVPNLIIRVIEDEFIIPGVVGLDGKVTGLVEKRQRIVAVLVGTGEGITVYGEFILCGQFAKLDDVILKSPDQQGRGPGAEPVAAEPLLAEGFNKAEGVVNTGDSLLLTKAIAVIHLSKFTQACLTGKLFRRCQRIDFRTERFLHLRLCDPAKRGVRLVHRKDVELVKVAEDGNLCELRNAGKPRKTEIMPHAFQIAEETLERGTNLFALFSFGLQKRLVVLIHKQDNLLAGLLPGR